MKERPKQPRKAQYHLYMDEIIQHFGGAEELCKAHTMIADASGYEYLSINTVLTWMRANKKDHTKGISIGRLLELKGVADALGLEFDLWKFCKKEK